MRIDEIEARKAEIKEQLAGDTSALDIDALTEEVRSLNTEADEIRAAAEKEAELRTAVEPAVVKEILENKENPKMEEVRTFAVDTPEYRNAWLKNLMGRELDAEERAAVSASAAIPTETMNIVVSYLEKNPLLAAVDMTHIPGNVSYPVESTNTDAAWVAMGSAATDGADGLTSVSLAAYKLIKTVEITADVQKMAIPAFEQYIAVQLANKIEKAIDAGIIGGGGAASNQCEGIKKAKNNTADSTWATTGITWKGLCGLMGALDSKYAQNASFVMGRELFFGSILGMEDSQHNRVVVADAQAPCKFNIVGYPVIIDDNLASNEMLFGDLKAYKFNFAQDPEIQADDSVAFRTGSRVYRGMALADGKLAVADAVKYFTKG